jgi:predicted nucleic acid-binding protein
VNLVVSDSGPIHYLVLCEVIEVLPKLYDRLVIPSAVVQELTHAHAPPTVSQWIRAMPQWASVQSPSQIDPSSRLGLGEREAIALALELKATQLLVDDRVARLVADQRGILTAGTTGILEQAAASGLLNLPQVMQKLLNTNFRIDAEVVREVLNRDADRRKASETSD